MQMTMPILPQVSPKATATRIPKGCAALLRAASSDNPWSNQCSNSNLRGKGGYEHRRQNEGKKGVQFKEEYADKDNRYARQ